MKARILLEDGTIFEGKSFGAEGTVFGEIVFNTGMTGYQEVLTDPSYAGQIVVMTYPLIGNYGINPEDVESGRIQVTGLVVKEFSKEENNFKSTDKLSNYLKKQNIPAVEGIDTRELTRIIRNFGTMKSVITTEEISAKLKQELKDFNFPTNLVEKVSRDKSEIISGNNYKIGLIDLGVKKSIVNHLKKQGCEIHIFPWNVTSETILAAKLDAVLFSNGPGDPVNAKEAIKTAKELIGKLPIYGICLGLQIIAIALGGNTYKLKFGHRGSNHPVIDLRDQKVMITAQNHGYAVNGDSLSGKAKITHINVNDETIEGFSVPELDIHTVQFHPEAGPGPTDANYIFERWIKLLDKGIKNA